MKYVAILILILINISAYAEVCRNIQLEYNNTLKSVSALGEAFKDEALNDILSEAFANNCKIERKGNEIHISRY